MVAQQLGLHEQSSTDDHQFQDPYDQLEEDDTLSLSDLPLTSSSDSSWDEYFSNKDGQNSSFGDEVFFEFFSEDFTASTYPSADKIVFCGKVIGTQKEEQQEQQEEERAVVRESESQEFKKGNLFHVQRTTSSRHQVKSGSTHKTLSSSPQGSLDKLVSSFSSSQLVKSKWYVLEFGMGSYWMEMKQRDIKKRQSRRAPATMFQTVEKGGMMDGNGRRAGKGLWGLLRRLGCKKNQKTQR